MPSSSYADDATGHLLSNGDATEAGTTVNNSATTKFAVPDTAAPVAGTPDLVGSHAAGGASSGSMTNGYSYDSALNTLTRTEYSALFWTAVENTKHEGRLQFALL